MAASVLLKLVRDSILEVYQTKRLINKPALLNSHPILATPLQCRVTIYLDNKEKSSFTTRSERSLLENIILAAKKATFEDPDTSPLTASEYLHAEIELTLFTDEGAISEKDAPIIKETSTLIV